MPPLSVRVALSELAEVAEMPLTAMSQAVVGLLVSTKVIVEELLKCVHVLPVIMTGTTVPEAPAPGDTTETAAGGGVAMAEPVSDAVRVDPPGAEFGIDNVPPRVGLGVIEVGEKLM